MAEALAVIGAVGAVCNIVDVISKTITLISEVQSRWKLADLALMSLASQLTALRAALTEIEKWLQANSQEMHHQLVMDLDVSLSCCHALASELEKFFTRLNTSPYHPLSASGKMKVVIGGQSANDIRKFIEHQTSALTLLLTACNCTTLSEQKQLLERPQTRKTLSRANNDSISLFVHRDSASFVTRFTDNLSKLSRVFDFDTEVFSTKPYERVHRSSVKQALRKKQAVHLPSPQQYILLLGDDDIGKMRVASSILAQHSFEQSPESILLAQSSRKLRKACVNLTLTVAGTMNDPGFRFKRLAESDVIKAKDPMDHIITTLWRLEAFRKSLSEFTGNQESLAARNYILGSTKSQTQIPEVVQDAVSSAIYSTSASPPPMFSSGTASCTAFMVKDISVALLHCWGTDVTLLQTWNGDILPSMVFYVQDLCLDEQTLMERLEELSSTVKQLRNPNALSITLIFTNAKMFKIREGPPTEGAIKAVGRVMRKIDSLSHNFFIIASGEYPADLDRYLLVTISRMPKNPPTDRALTDDDLYMTESDTESIFDMGDVEVP